MRITWIMIKILQFRFVILSPLAKITEISSVSGFSTNGHRQVFELHCLFVCCTQLHDEIGDVGIQKFSLSLSPQTRYIVPILDGREVQKAVLLYFGATTKPKKIRTLCYSKPSDFPCFVLPNQKFRSVGLQNTNRNAQCKRPAGKNYLQITNAPRPQVVVYTNNTESTQLRACATWYVHVVLLAEYPCKL